jgi:hypothetical protein
VKGVLGLTQLLGIRENMENFKFADWFTSGEILVGVGWRKDTSNCVSNKFGLLCVGVSIICLYEENGGEMYKRVYFVWPKDQL